MQRQPLRRIFSTTQLKMTMWKEVPISYSPKQCIHIVLQLNQKNIDHSPRNGAEQRIYQDAQRLCEIIKWV